MLRCPIHSPADPPPIPAIALLRRLLAAHADSAAALWALRRAAGEDAPAVAWAGLKAGALSAADPELWPLLAQGAPAGEDTRAWLAAWAEAQPAGSWGWRGPLDEILAATSDLGPTIASLGALPEPGRTQAAYALARQGRLRPEALPEGALERVARAFLQGLDEGPPAGAALWPQERWRAAAREAARDLGGRALPERLRPSLAGASPQEAAALVGASIWPQLGLWAAQDRGRAVWVALMMEADRALQEGPGRSPGALGLLLGLAQFGPLPPRFDGILAPFLSSGYAEPIQGALFAALRALPVERREALLIAGRPEPAWRFLEACPTPRARAAAVAGIVAHPSAGASYSGDIVADALVDVGAREEVRRALSQPLAPRARRVLAHALARLALPGDAPALAALADHDDPEVRALARWGLDRLRPPASAGRADALLAAHLAALARPHSYSDPYALAVALDELGEVERFADALLRAPPTADPAYALQALQRLPAAVPAVPAVAEALAGGLGAEQAHSAALYDWLAGQPDPSPARRAAFRRGLADRRPPVVSVCRQALRALGEDVGEAPLWDFERDLPPDPVGRFRGLGLSLAARAQWGRFQVALRHAGGAFFLDSPGGQSDEAAAAEAALRALPLDPGAPPLRQFGRLTRCLEPLGMHPLDGPLIEPLPAGGRDCVLCSPEEAAEILRRMIRVEGPSGLPSRDSALAEAAVASLAGLGARPWRTDRRLVRGFCDGGVLFAAADFSCLGLIWYDNDQ